EPGMAMMTSDRGHARCVVRVAVRHQHLAKLCAMLIQRACEFLEMLCLSDASIDQHSGVVADEEIGVIPRPSHRAWIVRLEPDWIEHRGRNFGFSRTLVTVPNRHRCI